MGIPLEDVLAEDNGKLERENDTLRAEVNRLKDALLDYQTKCSDAAAMCRRTGKRTWAPIFDELSDQMLGTLQKGQDE